MRFLMDFMSGVSYFINQAISEKQVQGPEGVRLRAAADAPDLDRVDPVHHDVVRHELAADQRPGRVAARRRLDVPNLWWQLATIISCGTLAAVLIPEFTKIFTSSHSKHVHEIVTASREGGASLTILSGIVAGNFSAFWKGMLIAGLMAAAYFVSLLGLDHVMQVQLMQASRWSASARSSRSAWWRSASCAWARSTSPSIATAR